MSERLKWITYLSLTINVVLTLLVILLVKSIR